MIYLSTENITSFQEKILSWYADNKRDLPWRRTRDPYKILVSEIMSQQTQINRVIPKYEAWIQRFPTMYELGKASTTDVLHYWSGLGYNRRAVYLQRTAKEIVEKFEGKFPEDEKSLRTLPGIGEYTARAVMCFAFNQQIAVVDTNVRRVILTQFHVTNLKSQISNKDLQEIATQLLPLGHAYEWNQALMDYAGATLKKEKIPIPKQAPFKNSDRYFRGQVIKYLLKEKQVTIEDLIVYFEKRANFINEERIAKIVKSLLKDTLVKETDGNIEIK